MSSDENQQTDAEQQGDAAEPAQTQESGYSVTDLPEGATPDPLGDATLSPEERAGAGGSGE